MTRFQNLDITDLQKDPFEQFNLWFEDAKKHIPLYPEAMSVSTLDDKGYPQSRYVLLRGYKPPVFQFFTNYSSHKGQEILAYPKASLLFYWKELGRQIRISGLVQKSSPEDSDLYWKTRPQESQIHAMASHQSQNVENFKAFLESIHQLEDQYKNLDIPRPAHWGGFDFTAQNFEFWQEGEFRLHHRFFYSHDKFEKWTIQRLYP